MSALTSRTVLLHVYDMHSANSWLGAIGLGVHHSGVEIGGKEYTFSAQGITHHPPKAAASETVIFKCTIPMGSFEGSYNEVHRIVRELRDDGGFGPGTYSVTQRNCNHFAESFCHALTGESVPAWLNRAAGVGGFFGVGGNASPSLISMSGSGAGSVSATESDSVASAGNGGSGDRTKKRALTEKQRQLLGKIKK